MIKYLRSIVDIRKGEIALTLLMLSSYYLILMTYYLLKPARDSLFLVKVDPKLLPVVFIITALVTVPVVSAYNRASRSLKLNQLVNYTYAVLIVNLVVLWWLVQHDDTWIFYLFYTWVSLYGALTTSQFWLLANSVFDAAQAKRIFVLLGLGGIVGAFTGGEVTGIIVSTFGVATQDLLFFCIGFLIVCAILINATFKLKKREDFSEASAISSKKESRESFGELFKTIKSSRHLLSIVGIIALMMMVASFVDYQFKIISKESFPNTGELTAFLGTFYGRLSLISLFLQLFMAQRLLRYLGAGGVIMFLPIGLLVSSVAMFAVPCLLTAVLVRGTDGSIKYSLDKTSRELMFLPVPHDVKRRTKMFIDVFIDRWFRGVAGGLLLLCTLVLDLSIRQISLVVIFFVALWMLLTFFIRKEYVNAFRIALEKRTIDPDEIRINIAESSVITSLKKSLQSDNERQVIYALDMLASVKDVSLVDACQPLLNHKSSEVRAKVLKVLQYQGDGELVTEVKMRLDDDSSVVRKEALYFLYLHTDGDRSHFYQVFLDHPNLKLQLAAITCIVEYGTPEEKRLIDEGIIRSLFEQKGENGIASKIQVARILGSVNRPEFYKYFKRILHSPEQDIVKEGMASVGKIKNREYVPFLLNKLADQNYRASANRALTAFGTQILGTLNDYLTDERIDLRARLAIPKVLSNIPHQLSVEILSNSLESCSSNLKYFILKALNRLRENNPGLKFDKKQVDKVILNETRAYYEIVQVLNCHKGESDNQAKNLLRKALVEKMDQNLENIFRALGLRYPSKDIYSAYLGLISNRKTVRANAVAFLDNLLGNEIKRYILPIIDEITPEVTVKKGCELFGLDIDNKGKALIYLINGRDIWLKTCALYAIENAFSPGVSDLVEKALNDPDPMVRETAKLVQRRVQ